MLTYKQDHKCVIGGWFRCAYSCSAIGNSRSISYYNSDIAARCFVCTHCSIADTHTTGKQLTPAITELYWHPPIVCFYYKAYERL